MQLFFNLAVDGSLANVAHAFNPISFGLVRALGSGLAISYLSALCLLREPTRK